MIVNDTVQLLKSTLALVKKVGGMRANSKCVAVRWTPVSSW